MLFVLLPLANVEILNTSINNNKHNDDATEEYCENLHSMRYAPTIQDTRTLQLNLNSHSINPTNDYKFQTNGPHAPIEQLIYAPY